VAGQTAIQVRVDRRLLNPPANDTCAGAEAIPDSGPFPYLTSTTADITDATTAGDPAAPSCQVNVFRGIWYSFTPAAAGDYTFSSCADGPTGTTVDDTAMAVYTSAGGCGGPFTQWAGACDDDTCSQETLQAVLTASLTAGTTYYVLVWQVGATAPTPANAAVQLRVSQPGPPPNDLCAAASPLVLDTPVMGTTVLAADDYELADSACFTGIGQVVSTAVGRDAAYSFTAPAAGEYSFRVTGYSTSRNLVTYTAGACPAGPSPALVTSCLSAANRSTSSSSEEVMCLPLSAGQTVYTFVDENALTAGSLFKIEVNWCARETEPNDLPGSAIVPVCGTEATISPAAEADFYSLGTPASGARVFALIDGVASSSNDFDLRVTTDTDTLEYDDQNNDAAFGSLAPNVAGTPLTGIAAYLRVNHFSSIRTAEPYRVYAAVQPPMGSATPEVEPNDATAQANTSANDYYSGSLSALTDVDLFRFTAAAGDLVFLSLDGDPLRNNTPINGALTLQEASGFILAQVNDAGSTSSNTSGSGSLTLKTPNSPSEGLVYRISAPGAYYTKVTGSVGGDYLLSISRLCTADLDGDGVDNGSDCAPSDPSAFAVPGEVAHLTFIDATTLHWDSAAPAAGVGTVHQVLRGVLSQLPVGSGVSETCVATGEAGTGYGDATLPAPGTGFWYLVRGKNSCGLGTYGTRSNGTPRTSAACP
jgi:hypothetical protein